MKFILGIIVFLSFACSLQAHGTDHATAGKAFVRTLYKPYGTGADTNYLGKPAPEIFTTRLLKLIRSDQTISPGDVGKLDEDPLCECQDDDGFRLSSIDMYRLSANRMTARVSFVIGVVPKVITLDLVTSNGAWRIADIHSRRIPSLVLFLSYAGTPH